MWPKCTMRHVVGAAVALALCKVSEACTYFELTTNLENNSKIMGHTMEFDNIYGITNWKLFTRPRGHVMELNNVSKTTAHGTFGVLGLGVPPFFADGMNEKGLTLATQSLYRSEYQECNPFSKEYQTIYTVQVPQWILTHFATVAEVVNAIQSGKYCIANPMDTLVRRGNIHWAIADKDGNSIVLEYERGEPKVYNNHVGVMTNDPFYPWHVDNLNTYRWILPEEGNNKVLRMSTGNLLAGQKEVPYDLGHGFNTGGLPGDTSPPSRFVRAFFTRQVSQANARPKQELNDWLTLAQGILNSIFITKGWTGPNPAGHIWESDHTAWGTLRFPQTGFYAFRTYANMQWQVVNTTKLDWMEGVVLATSTSIADSFNDITAHLNLAGGSSSKASLRQRYSGVSKHPQVEDTVLLQSPSQEL